MPQKISPHNKELANNCWDYTIERSMLWALEALYGPKQLAVISRVMLREEEYSKNALAIALDSVQRHLEHEITLALAGAEPQNR